MFYNYDKDNNLSPDPHQTDINPSSGPYPPEAVPAAPSYHAEGTAGTCGPPSDSDRPPKKKNRFARAVAALLVTAVVGGAAGVGGAQLWLDHAAADTGGETVTLGSAAPSPNVTTIASTGGGTLTAGEIYSLGCAQVVGISADVTMTNIFGQSSTASVSGSGFIISADGYIVTNYHVVESAVTSGSDITVMLYNGESYTAEYVGGDSDSDLTVLKIQASGLSAVALGDSNSIQTGDEIYAVGNPLGELSYTMTAGIVSALDRDIQVDAATSLNMFQIDAAVNSGNSGGPVYNAAGEVIGIVTAKYSDTGVEGIGFAIPINDALSIIGELIENGYVTGKPDLGITVVTISGDTARYYNMAEGSYIYSVGEGSCAEAAGLQPGDIITGFGGTDITSNSDLTSAVKQYKAGDTVSLTYYRGGESHETEVTLDEKTGSGAASQATQAYPGSTAQLPGSGRS